MPVDPDPPLRRLGRCAGVDCLDSQSIDSTGATALDEVLLRLPVVGFQGVNANQNAGGYGATFVDLRNLNFNRTLVLIDGRRSVLSGIQTDEAVDLSTIPVELVDVNLTTLGRLTIVRRARGCSTTGSKKRERFPIWYRLAV